MSNKLQQQQMFQQKLDSTKNMIVSNMEKEVFFVYSFGHGEFREKDIICNVKWN